jgi:hypothetical protein
VGYSASSRRDRRLDELVLHVPDWRVEPLAVDTVASTFFDDRRTFPAGTVEFDCALLARKVAHEWHGIAPLRPPRARDGVRLRPSSCARTTQ